MATATSSTMETASMITGLGGSYKQTASIFEPISIAAVEIAPYEHSPGNCIVLNKKASWNKEQEAAAYDIPKGG